MRNAKVRCGVTLIEVLVLAGILVVLLALVLPAIQRVREVANLAYCKSNLRTIGLAIAEITAGNQPFPMGGASDPEGDKSWEFHLHPTGPELPTSGVRQNWGWAYQMLPQLGYREQ